MSKNKKTTFNYKNIVQNSTEDFVKLPDGTLQALEYKGNQIVKLHMDGIGRQNGLTMTSKNFLRVINEIELRGGLTALKDAIMPLAKAEKETPKTKISNGGSKEVTELRKEFEELKGLIKKLAS